MRPPRAPRLFALVVVLVTALAIGSGPARARPSGSSSPILHEPIPADPTEDARLGVSIDGDLPAALNTPSGVVSAPDPHRPPSAPSPSPGMDSPNATFHPDRDTHRPEVVPYDDPFTPSTAPFKRLVAFDSVSPSYTLYVRDARLTPLASHGQAAADGSDDSFFGDLVVDLVPDRPQRIPSVGPGAKIVHARAGVGSTDVPVRFFKDGAENWFVTGEETTRARLVLEIAVPRAAFGGELSDASWSDLPKIPALPPNVARAAADVAVRIGVSRAISPREALVKLVAYFRGFTDSDEFPTEGEDVYLALALSKKGVCRHRAFAFLVTALGLGLPTRMVMNEAHAWVEVNDGTLWRRIDLGGAGRALDASLAGGVKHATPPDPFSWPANASRGDDLAEGARSATGSPGSSGGKNGATPATAPSAAASAADPRGDALMSTDERPASHLTLVLKDAEIRRGGALHVSGDVRAEGGPCGHLLVQIEAEDGHHHAIALGALATAEDGKYDGVLVVPASVPLGDYDLVVHTDGDARCGRGGS
ncbi:MAG TPA: transglutaminase domain-containing protein [Polyangiaceae bacterium]|jgi:transglutaminase-like putative cysteine protease